MIIFHRIQEYQRYKEEREAKLAEERRLEKLEKEKAKTTVAIQTLQARGQQVFNYLINGIILFSIYLNFLPYVAIIRFWFKYQSLWIPFLFVSSYCIL